MQVIGNLQSGGGTPLHTAALSESPENIKAAWESGQEAYTSIDILNQQKRTPLQLAAAFNGNPESIKTLVDLGASLDAGKADNLTPRDLVNMNSNLSPEDKAKAREYLRSS